MTEISNIFVGELSVDVVVSGLGYDDEFVLFEWHALDGETGEIFFDVHPGDPSICVDTQKRETTLD